jgi:L-aminopeptidase/D-esterase-like protein
MSSLVDIPGIKVGHAQDAEALTGCTVILTEKGAVCGVDVRGAAPGTRETDLLSPFNLVQYVHGICLTGGSAYGLAAADGVMRYLEDNDCGLDVGVAKVPIVPAAVLFDLGVGNAQVRPDAEMGYLAATQASTTPVAEGNVGAGTGATVGKLAGIHRAMKGGIGSTSYRHQSGLIVGALVAVNAVGSVFDPRTNVQLAGPRDAHGRLMKNHIDLLARAAERQLPGTNTTIAVVACNARLNKAQAGKVAQMAHDGLARSIYPIHTMHDGDTVFALATGEMESTVDLVGTLAADVLADAVARAIRAATSVQGIPAYCDM